MKHIQLVNQDGYSSFRMCLKLTVLSLILTVALAQLNFTKHVDEDLKTANCPLIQNYRILIEWFFDESTYIKFTDISEISDISNNIVQGLMQSRYNLCYSSSNVC